TEKQPLLIQLIKLPFLTWRWVFFLNFFKHKRISILEILTFYTHRFWE
ncbi:MAG: hypothetical protein ACI9WO_001125, partial [Sphingobacteriales bacterium]